MRKLVANLFISLDGVVEAPDKWSPRYRSDEIAAAVDASMAAAGAMLLGRVADEDPTSRSPSRRRPRSIDNGVVQLTYAKA